MKNVLKLFLAGGLALTMASCGSADPYYGNRYPNTGYPSGGTVYRTPDGQVYRQGDVYRDRRGDVYQNGRILERTGILNRPGILSRGGTYGQSGKIPPGQAKKIYGGHARDYAHGQQKKRGNGYYSNDRRYQDQYKGKKGNKGKGYDKRKNDDRWDD